MWKPVEDLHKIKVVSAPVCQNIIWNCLHVFNVSVSVCVCVFKSSRVKPLTVLYVGGIDRVHACVL